ncbi:MAG TPA: hypothetical protein VF271_04320 [Rhodanobacteraceae bacterium]
MLCLPDICARRAGPDWLEVDLRVDADGAWFDGHFPGHPIVPGVVQIGWAAHFARDLLGGSEPPAQLERVKFRQPVGPDAELTLSLHRVNAKVRWQFTARDGGAVSSGVLGVLDA